jgi:hypothetical protein
MNMKWFLMGISFIVLLNSSCFKYSDLTINGVRITESTVWRDIINDDEEKNAMDQITRNVNSLLMGSRFDELEALAEEYRTSRLKFKNGKWALLCFYSGLCDSNNQADYEMRLARLREWVSSKPNSVTPRIALCECLIGYAFFARGSGYADSVTEEKWQLFHERMNEAQSVIQASESMRDACPQWRAAQLRMVSGNLDHDEFIQAFNDAVAFNPEYTTYYFRISVALLPRWYGSEGEVEEFWKNTADSIGGIKGDILYAQMVRYLDEKVKLNYLGRMDPKIDWFRVKRGVEALNS